MRADSPTDAYVLHASPAWRTKAELSWCHRLARDISRRVPQAVAPLEVDGETLFDWRGYRVAAFPFIEGQRLDRNKPQLRAAAAGLLASIHRALADERGAPRPSSGSAPTVKSRPVELNDTDLDAWRQAAELGDVMRSLTHGDYYPGNLLCRDDKIVGVIDWHDAAFGSVAFELAGAVFEFCKNEAHELQFDQADAFVAGYRAAGGPLPAHEYRWLPHLMRLWIRRDAINSLSTESDLGQEYAQRQIRAFQHLAKRRWVPNPTR